MHFWHNEVLFDVMTHILTSQRTSWRTFWYYNILVMTYFVDLMNKQYSLRKSKYCNINFWHPLNSYIYIYWGGLCKIWHSLNTCFLYNLFIPANSDIDVICILPTFIPSNRGGHNQSISVYMINIPLPLYLSAHPTQRTAHSTQRTALIQPS